MAEAVSVLKAGGLVAYPTDTVYGLGANAFDEVAVARVFAAKKRPSQLALPLLLVEAEDMVKVARDIPERAWRLAAHFFPGGLTLVLWRSARVPVVVSGGSDTVAVRVPNHPVPRALARGLGAPITGTSANITGQPSPATASEVAKQLGDQVDIIIEGPCPGGVESTVLDLTPVVPRILRQGAVAKEALEEVLGLDLSLAG